MRSAIVVGEVQLELAGRVLVVALDHVEAHLAAILDDPHVDGPEALELVDVIAVGPRIAAVWRAVLALLQPHHLRLGAVPELQAVVLLERVMDAVQVAARVRGQESAGVLALLAVAEERAPDARHPLVPGQLHEGLGLGDADQLRRLRAVAEIVAVPVQEEVHGGAVDELEALFGDRLPVLGRDALAHDAAGHGDELQIEVFDAERVDLLAHFADQRLAVPLLYESFDIHRRLGATGRPAQQSAALLAHPRLGRHRPTGSLLRHRYQLHGNGLWEVGCNSPRSKREKRNGSSSALFSPISSCATSLPTPIIL